MTQHVIEKDQHARQQSSPPPQSGHDDPLDQDAPSNRYLGLSLTQLLGGAGAAVSSAVVASFLGVAGTLIGAAVGSVVSTVSAALYTNWATTARGRLPARALVRRDTLAGAERSGPSDALDSGPVVVTAGRTARNRRFKRGIAGTVVMFVFAIGVITAIELGLGHPVSTQDRQGSTSIGAVVDSGPQAPAPSPVPTTGPSDPATPSVEQPGSVPSGRSPEATGTPTSPEATPSLDTAPADPGAPVDTPGRGTAGADQPAAPASP
ncbi:MAG: hypothetical protein IPL37_05755 [Austwickia sp.]|nr:hypothetical protein [Austwickia sp.]